MTWVKVTRVERGIRSGYKVESYSVSFRYDLYLTRIASSMVIFSDQCFPYRIDALDIILAHNCHMLCNIVSTTASQSAYPLSP